jgi:hypothetical protein
MAHKVTVITKSIAIRSAEVSYAGHSLTVMVA